jgi:hypothetical protein
MVHNVGRTVFVSRLDFLAMARAKPSGMWVVLFTAGTHRSYVMWPLAKNTGGCSVVVTPFLLRRRSKAGPEGVHTVRR